MTILGRGDLAPARRGRRRRTPVFVALAVLLLAAAGYVGWRELGGGSSTGAHPAVVCTTPSGGPSPAAAASVSVSVLNGTKTVGLAHAVATQLTKRGFHVVSVGNTRTPVTGPVRIGHAPGDEGAALALAEQVPGATLESLATAKPGVVVLQIGSDYHQLASPAEAASARAKDVAATAPSPAVCTTPHS